MGFKDILVYVDNGRNHETRIALAVELARRHQAHLVGIAGYEPLPLLGLSTGSTGGYLDVQTIDMLQQQARETALDAGRTEESVFTAAASAAGISHEWHQFEGEIARTVTGHARYADLVILGQPDPDAAAAGSASHLPETALLGAGRPVLVVPYAGRFESVTERVLVTWNGTREATRAVHDAMPLLRSAKSVAVLTVVPAGDSADEEAAPPLDITRHLARHGVSAEATKAVADNIDVGDLILSRAADFGSDLIVMGGYGHSRLREWVLGGVTHSLLQHMTVPVLLSH